MNVPKDQQADHRLADARQGLVNSGWSETGKGWVLGHIAKPYPLATAVRLNAILQELDE